MHSLKSEATRSSTKPVPTAGITDEPSNLSTTDRAYNELRRRILAGEIDDGGSISANSLASELGVSRTPVREALVRLHNDKLIEKTSTGRLMPVTISYSRAADLFVTRAASEGMAARLAAIAATSKQIAQLKRICEMSWHSFGQEQRTELIEQNEEFHSEILRIADAPGLTRMTEHSAALIYKYRMASLLTPERMRRSLETHDEITRLIEAGSADEVEALARSHAYAAGRVFLDVLATFVSVDRETPAAILIKQMTRDWSDL